MSQMTLVESEGDFPKVSQPVKRQDDELASEVARVGCLVIGNVTLYAYNHWLVDQSSDELSTKMYLKCVKPIQLAYERCYPILNAQDQVRANSLVACSIFDCARLMLWVTSDLFLGKNKVPMVHKRSMKAISLSYSRALLTFDACTKILISLVLTKC
ncbi:hypothetical protein MA16_Dca014605 [Dendrobium catenatum]|uniref:Uncharacterized protein n=1 Tax=Dendrobium catenatum TaxID=906689 RepID=A0A2I0WYP8_9ASPA|nr:hypothetical protein MA16_Dca014605 [Dendrobium catenatum]